jgi:hypothetical protein
MSHHPNRPTRAAAATYVARGRALAVFRRGQCDMVELAAVLERVRDEGERLGIRVALPGIEATINQLHG